jgi:hypothetical protein
MASSTSTTGMPLSCVTDCLFQSDSFWGNANLNVLRMMVSVCKGLKSELLGDEKKKKKEVQRMPLLNHALLTMIRLQPALNDNWTLSFKTAKYRFSLQYDTMLKHCAALPAQDKFHLTVDNVRAFKEDDFEAHIRFIDAFNLASRIGMKIVMERRDQFETKTIKSAIDILLLVERNFKPLRLNVKAAVVQLKKDLATMRNGAVGKKELLKGIRVLDQLLTDLCCAEWKCMNVSSSIRPTTKRDYLSIESDVGDLRGWKKTLVKRYKKHSVFCPELMKTDCLAVFEVFVPFTGKGNRLV